MSHENTQLAGAERPLHAEEQPSAQDESLVHQLLADVVAGRAALKRQARLYRRDGNFAAVAQLLQRYRALIEQGLLTPVDAIEVKLQTYWTAEALAEQGKTAKGDAAADALRKAVEAFVPATQLPIILANSTAQWRAQIDTYQRAFVAKQLEQARAAGDQTRHALWLAEIADLDRAQGTLKTALPQLNEALTLAPTYAHIWAYRGETQRHLQHYAEALTDFDQALALDAHYDWVMAERGDTKRLLKHYQEALLDFDQALALDDQDVWAFTQRGQTYVLLGAYEQAVADFDRALALAEGQVEVWLARGEVYLLMAAFDQALLDFDRVLALDAKNAWAWGRRSLLQRRLGHYDQALAAIDQALKKDKEQQRLSWYHYCRGLVQLCQGQAKLALKEFQQASKIATTLAAKDPTNTANHFNLLLYGLATDPKGQGPADLTDIIAQADSPHFLKVAHFLVKDLLTIIPDQPQATLVLQQLQSHIQAKFSLDMALVK